MERLNPTIEQMLVPQVPAFAFRADRAASTGGGAGFVLPVTPDRGVTSTRHITGRSGATY